MRKLLTIAAYEFGRNARRASYLILTFSVPVVALVAVLLGRSANPLSSAIGVQGAPIGYVDSASVLPFPRPAPDFRRFPSETAARDAMVSGEIDHYVVVPPDYLRSGRVQLYNRAISLTGEGTTQEAAREFLARSLVGDSLPQATEHRAISAPNFTLFQVDAHGQIQSLQSAARQLLVGNIFSILLGIAIFSASQFLLQGVSEEKENRVMEVLLSSVSPEQLMNGKILGLGALGLAQVLVWTLTTQAMAPLAPSGLRAITDVSASPATLAPLILFFLLGYLFYASLMAAIGAMASSIREGQQIAGLLATLSFVPIWFAGTLVNAPEGRVALILSYLPVTAPTAIMERLPSGEVSVPELLGEAAVLAVFVVAMTVAATRIFRAGLLLYGQRLSPRSVLLALRGA